MIAANLYVQDLEIHSCIDRWEDNLGPSGVYVTSTSEMWEELPEEAQQTYIGWVMFLIQSHRM